MYYLIIFCLNFGIATILSSERIFESLRAGVYKRSVFFGYLFSCPKCLGFWIGAVMSAFGLGISSDFLNVAIHNFFYVFFDSVIYYVSTLTLVSIFSLLSVIADYYKLKINEMLSE
jgi:hypothetical protein